MSSRAELLNKVQKLLTKQGTGRYFLDARGYTCPYPQLLAGIAMEVVDTGSVVEILTDNPPSCENVPRSLKNRGQKVLAVENAAPGLWKIVAQKVS